MSPLAASTEYEHFLYLLSELEKVIKRGRIKWPADNTGAVERRLAQIILKVSEKNLEGTAPRRVPRAPRVGT